MKQWLFINSNITRLSVFVSTVFSRSREFTRSSQLMTLDRSMEGVLWCLSVRNDTLGILWLVFANPVYRTENIGRTELEWTTVQSFSSCSCQIWGQCSCQLPCFCIYLKLKKTGSDWLQLVFCPIMCWTLLTHTYLLNFWSLNHQKQSRIGWDMAKIIFVHIFCLTYNYFMYS